MSVQLRLVSGARAIKGTDPKVKVKADSINLVLSFFSSAISLTPRRDHQSSPRAFLSPDHPHRHSPTHPTVVDLNEIHTLRFVPSLLTFQRLSRTFILMRGGGVPNQSRFTTNQPRKKRSFAFSPSTVNSTRYFQVAMWGLAQAPPHR